MGQLFLRKLCISMVIVFIAIVLFLLIGSSNSQAVDEMSPEWVVTSGGSGQQSGTCISEYNGNLYIAGMTPYQATFDDTVLITKFSTDGDFVWNATLNYIDDYIYVNDMMIHNDSIFILVSTSGSDTGFRLFKCDMSGNEIWNQTWSGPDRNSAGGMTIYNDRIYIIGTTEGYGAGGYDVLFVTYDLNGNMLINKTWGTNRSERGYDIIEE